MANSLAVPSAIVLSFVQSKLFHNNIIDIKCETGQRALCNGDQGFPIGGIDKHFTLIHYLFILVYNANKTHLLSFLANDRLGATSRSGRENS